MLFEYKYLYHDKSIFTSFSEYPNYPVNIKRTMSDITKVSYNNSYLINNFVYDALYHVSQFATRLAIIVDLN